MIKDVIVDFGVNVVKNCAKDTADEHLLKMRFEKYFEQKWKEHKYSDLENEIDLQGLIDYLVNIGMTEISQRVFGNLEERQRARQDLFQKSCAYAHTNSKKLAEEKVAKIVLDIVDLIRAFYLGKISSEEKAILFSIEDNIISNSNENTDLLLEKLSAVQESQQRTEAIILSQNTPQNPTEALMKIQQMEQSMLHPVSGYRYEYNSFLRGFVSKPVGECEANENKKYLKVTGTIQMGGTLVNKMSCDVIDYANRHQLPITITIETAHSYLGEHEDPSQCEAKAVEGEQITIEPTPYPPAFPCSIVFDNERVGIEYLLLRTKEIWEDGTYIVTNEEQVPLPFEVRIMLNFQKKQFDINVACRSNKAANKYEYLKFLSESTSTKIVSIKLLATRQMLGSGCLHNQPTEDNLDEIRQNLEFLQHVLILEKFFQVEFDVPDVVSNDDYRTVLYASDLVSKKEVVHKWNSMGVLLDVRTLRRFDICAEECFAICYRGKESLNILGVHQEIEVSHQFSSSAIAEPERVQQKLAVLDENDSIEVKFVSTVGSTYSKKIVLEDTE